MNFNPRTTIPAPSIWTVFAGFLLLLGSLSCVRGDHRPSFILISLDTTRADRLGLAGYTRDTTRHLDSLAERSIVFEQAITPSNNTLISHASMLTGLFPEAHGATYLNNGIPLLESYSTIAEYFAGAGYQTAGFAAHQDWLNARFGMDQGFQIFTTGYRSADVVIPEALDWLSVRDKDRPFFLFIHLFDVHSKFNDRPYDCPKPFKGMYTGDYTGNLEPWAKQPVKGSKFLQAVHKGEIELTPEDLRYISNQYDEGLRYTDDRLSQFFQSMASLNNTYLVVTADHGEQFDGKGGMLHSSLHDQVLRVPLIIMPPPERLDLLGAPRRLTDQVCTVDILPTMLALADLPIPRVCQGVNLLPWLMGKDAACPSGPVPFWQHRGLRFNQFKLLWHKKKIRLYNLEEDPEERVDIHQRDGMNKVLIGMLNHLTEQEKLAKMIRNAHLRSGGAQNLSEDPEAEEWLRKLGYTR